MDLWHAENTPDHRARKNTLSPNEYAPSSRTAFQLAKDGRATARTAGRETIKRVAHKQRVCPLPKLSCRFGLK